MTAHAMPGDRQRCLEVGMDDYLVKPVDPHAMFETVEGVATGGVDESDLLPLDEVTGDENGNGTEVPPDMPADPSAAEETGKLDPAPAANALFNLQELLLHCGGDAEVMEEIVGLFLENYPSQLAAIQQALEAEDAERVGRAAHLLKGSVSHFAAPLVTRAVKALEQAGRSGDLALAAEHCGELEAQIEQLKAGLQEVLGGAAASET